MEKGERLEERRYSARKHEEVEEIGEEKGAGEEEKSNLPLGVVYVVPVRILLIIISSVVIAIVVPGGHWGISLLPVVVVVVVVVVAGGMLPFWNSNEGSRRGWLTRRGL